MEHQRREELLFILERRMRQQGYSRRDFVRLSSGLSLAGLLAACGAPQQPQTQQGQSAAGTPSPQVTSPYSISDAEGLEWPKTVVPEPSGKVQISVSHAWDAVFWTRQQQFDKLFMERHPNITVKAENGPWDGYLQKYLTQAAGGTLPDVMYCQFAWAQQFISSNSFFALDDYIAKQPDFNMEDFTEPSNGFYQRGGKTYGLAYDCGPGMLYYNKDIFDKAGVKYPDSNWTLEDFKQTAIKLTSGSGRNKIFGFNGTPSPGDGSVAPPFLFPFGARYVNEPQETQSFLTEPASIQAFDWWMELRHKYNAIPSPADEQALEQQGGSFTVGRVAMQLNGSWATPGLNQNAKFKWDVALWPKGPVKRSTYAAGSAYAISQGSKQKDAAWIYLNEYLSTAGQIFMWGSTGRGSPARRSAWDSYFKSKFAPGNAKLVLEALEQFATNEILSQPSTPRVTTTATPIWDRVVENKLPVKDALTQIHQRIAPILAQNNQ